MSILDRTRSYGRHRAKTPAELRAELDEADCRLIALTAEVDRHAAQASALEYQLGQAGIRYSGALEDLRLSTEALQQVEATIRLRDAEVAALRERIDIGIKAEHVIAQTQEIPQLDGWFTTGPVVRLGTSPLAAVTNPGDLGVEDTQQIRVTT